MHFYAWCKGLKTGYYLRSGEQPSKAIQFAVGAKASARAKFAKVAVGNV